ncbi:MAG: tryptophan synthase subunit beta, partial [Candidatus Zixiibacteriota bacterium]
MGQPNELGYFGKYGGRFVPETAVTALLELDENYRRARKSKEFRNELRHLMSSYSGRPTPLYFAERLGRRWNGARIFLKREDLNHTGAHKINNCLGQGLLAKKMRKKRVIAETGAGQHGVAVATVACLFGMQCTVYMGSDDVVRQKPNVARMQLLGAEVIPVNSGSKTLKDATNEAIRDWIRNIGNTHYVIGSTVGPHPYPLMVRDFQAIIGQETKKQIKRQTGCLPDIIIACVGGGSNALGMFHAFIQDRGVRLIGVESAGNGISTSLHAATLSKGKPGVLHGSFSYLLQDKYGQVKPTHSVSAGLDYPGVGPEHSYLRDSGRVKYVHMSDNSALSAFFELAKTEGIIPALESSFALAYAKKLAR